MTRPPRRRPEAVNTPRESARAARDTGRTPPRDARAGAWLYGLHPVAAAWSNPDRRVNRLLVTAAARDALAPAAAAARSAGLPRPEPTVVDKAELDRLLAGAVHQGAALDAAPLPELDLSDILRMADSKPAASIVVLDQVTDPHNVGAILRSAAAFGALAVVVTERHAPEVTGVLAKSASGALEAVPLVRVVNLARALGELQEGGFWCVGLDESGESTLARMDLTGRTALVLGAEGAGLRRLTRERCDAIARLPTGGPIGSLNVSNAAAVALYELVRTR